MLHHCRLGLPDSSRNRTVGDGSAIRLLSNNELAVKSFVFDDFRTQKFIGDVFTFTGDKETFGNVVVEAMASGLPVLAPNSGGVTDLVIDRYNGRQYDPYTPGHMVEAARELIKSPSLAQEYGKKGRELAEGRTWEITLDELLSHYQKVIHMDRPRGRYKWLIWERVPLASELNELKDRWLK